MRVEKKVTVSIEGDELVRLLITALSPKAQSSVGRETVLYRAFANLTGCTDVEAVRMGNKYADKDRLPRITTDEFRKWLPGTLSQTFKEFMEGT